MGIDEIVSEGTPLRWHHHHIDTGIDRLSAAGIRASLDLPDAVPVGDDHAVEAQLLPQNIGEQGFRSVDFHTIDAVEGGHDRIYSGIKCARVARSMLS